MTDQGPLLPDDHRLQPIAASRREPILDVLRGFALLGILLVNIEFMRGAHVWFAMADGAIPQIEGADRITQFLVGWLASGKFISSFTIMFGVGSAIMVGRALERGTRPRRLLARRYGALALFGLAHMVLLFPGDVLFLYGVTGLVLLAFVGMTPRTAFVTSGLILTLIALAVTAMTALGALVADAADAAAMPAGFTTFITGIAERNAEAYSAGSYLDIIVANAWTSLLVQTTSLVTLPWILALFLFGFAVGRAGLIDDLANHRAQLRRAAAICLPVGLLLNIPLGLVGPAAAATGSTPVDGVGVGVFVGAAFAQIVGAPLLAVGYLSGLVLLCLRFGVVDRLARLGRTALSSYLLQSLLAMIVFGGLRAYDRLSATESMLVVAGIWLVLLVVAPWWTRRFAHGPVERLWRTMTYGRRPSNDPPLADTTR